MESTKSEYSHRFSLVSSSHEIVRLLPNCKDYDFASENYNTEGNLTILYQSLSVSSQSDCRGSLSSVLVYNDQSAPTGLEETIFLSNWIGKNVGTKVLLYHFFYLLKILKSCCYVVKLRKSFMS